MKKNTLNYIVDVVMFLLMMAIIDIGFHLNTSNKKKLGRLRQRYGFTMNDIGEAIRQEMIK